MKESSTLTIIDRGREVIQAEARAIQDFADQVNDKLLDVLSLLYECQGHVLVSGVGTSRAVAQRFAHLLSCSGTPALFISASDGLHGTSGAIKPDDIVYLISKGGQSEEINKFAEIAKARGAKLIAQTENPESALGLMSDSVFKVLAVEDTDPYGMVATGSSLVNSAAGDVLCTLLLEMRGYTKEEFAQTHPGGAVGRRIAEEGT